MGPTNKTSLRETPVELLANASNMALTFAVADPGFEEGGFQVCGESPCGCCVSGPW